MPLKALQDSTLTDSREWQSFANTALSTLAQKELESSSAKNDIEWKSFKIGELFENIQQGARLKKEDHIQGDLPFVMAGITNNGICGFIGNDNARKFKANAITIDILGNVFYRDYDFGASDDVGVFWNEHKLFNKEIMLFICASIQKSLMGRFDFGNKLRASRAFDLPCLLPILDSNNIDFTFMESFIKAIEKQHIETLYRFWESKLKAYNAVINGGGGVSFTLSEYEEFCKGLKAQDFQFEPYHSKSFLLETGFSPCHTEPLGEVSKAEFNKDISLTKLAQYDKNHNIEWKSFKIGDLFEKVSARFLGKGNKFNATSKVKNKEYCVPLVYAKFGDNGIMYWAREGDFETQKNILSIVCNGAIAAGKVYAQKERTGILAESYFIKFKNIDVSFETNLFFQCVLEKVLYPRYSRENLATWNNKVENENILLPILNNKILFDFIESFIKAVQKECIKGVVLWQEKQKKSV